MPPAASDDLFRQQSRFPGDNISADDTNILKPDNDTGGKSKKKSKSGSKGKNKGKVASKAPVEDLLEGSPPSVSQVEPSSFPEPDPPVEPPDNNINIVSPVLDALESLRDTTEQDFASRTNTWAKSIPFGKSPPNDGFEDDLTSGSPFGGFLTTQDKGGFSNPSSASPPPRTRPLSYGNGYSSSAFSRQQSVDRHKSHSVNSPFSDRIPPPHLPQAHFYRAPEVDIPSLSGQTRSPVDGQYSFCAFDTISSPSFKPSRTGGIVLLVGTDGALEVLAVEDRKTRLLGKLNGLNGRVVEAKVLPGVDSTPASVSRPHVAVIVHGPCNPAEDDGRASSTGSDANDISVATGRYPGAEKRQNRDDTRFYQTRVEVYSLRTGGHITTLFATNPTPCFENLPGLANYAPSPSGNLKLLASGSYLVLASGISGEVYIYSMSTYQCLGKTWTGIQSREARRYSTSSSSTDPDGSRNDSPHGATRADTPILALKGRWLAIAPPFATYRASINGLVPAPLVQGKVYGLETRSPPSRPATTCVTDVGEGESLLDKVARGVAQEFVRGARWMSDQGLQAWNNYWNKDQQQNSQQRRSQVMDFPPQGFNAFPPTHAQETQTASPAEPDLVSILDLKRLEDGGDTKSAILFNPVATFQVPNGCSFLSFSPSGLLLLTASKKGDVQYVWDLMQAKFCRAGVFLAEDSAGVSANVRQVARYSRLTESHIVDVIWCPPSGERLAVITLKGTVHVFDLPRNAFQWPPFRRARSSRRRQPPAEHPTEELTVRTTNTSALSSAIKLVGGKTQPILEAVRGRAPSAGSAFPAMNGFAIPAAAGMGGKAVAAGLSKSMGAAASGTVNTLRHVGENRLHISGFTREPAASRVTWIIYKGQPFLALVANGYFRLYRIKRSMLSNKSRQPQSVIGSKELEFRLPSNLSSPCGPMGISNFNPELTVHASLALPSNNSRPSASTKLKCQPLSQAELETNAPYQPFHTDQRVNLFTYSETGEAGGSTGPVPTGQWVFGDSIPMSKLHVRRISTGSEDDGLDVAHEHQQGFSGGIENLISLGNSTNNVEEVVITTRRKKKHSLSQHQASGEDGFFEDDCEVLDFAVDRV
ncbi:hypothetical protein ASPCAL07309 [Aspergillus calidoustus]|uniref:Uncharacterized protein n=1 Tax=Aspergillus calidoustus TaxID=454130 RepID=A0A0U5CAE2_ASPCI|nr:hypothetical protein ASPCAL07309 [Aspergillus calidoustus]